MTNRLYSVLMKRRVVYHPVIVILLLSFICCEQKPVFELVETLTALPLVVSRSPNTAVDLDVIMTEVQTKVQEKLPGAYFSGLSVRGECQELSKLDGALNLSFVKVKRRFLAEQIFVAQAEVIPSQQTMEIKIWLDSDRVTAPDPLVTDEQLKETLQIVDHRLSTFGVSNCEVSLSKFREAWSVRCTSYDRQTTPCLFGIDAETGEITGVPYGPSKPIP